MKPDKLTLFELFEKHRRYVVPLFQRPYVWTREGQWEPLWDDVVQKAKSVDEGTAKAPHFFGAVVLNQLPVFGKEVNAAEIVDGQQRLTTTQILLAAFRDLTNEEDTNQLHRDLKRLTVNDCVREHPFERFKVWPTNADRPAFEATLHPNGASGGRHTGHRLIQSYKFFRASIATFLEDNQDLERFSSPAELLFETLRRHLQFVVIELEQDDDPQVIFETLNARGAPLLPSDLVRNFVFFRLARTKQDVDRLYERWWQPYDVLPDATSKDGTPFWKREERQGRFKRPRLDLFFHHYVQCKAERDINLGHLFQEFKDWWNDDEESKDPVVLLKDIKTHSAEFARWIQPTGDGPVETFNRRLKALDTSMVYPLLLLLGVERRNSIPEGDFVGILADLESYLVRRAVCRLSSKSYSRFFVSLVKRLRPVPDITRGIVREILMESRSDTARWPDDIEFGQHWLNMPAYKQIRRATLTMMLEALDCQLRTRLQERVRLDDKSLSIEHVLPQKWRRSDGWALPDDAPEGWRDHMLHTIGNLTLVTQPLNSRASNGSYEVKRSALTHSVLVMNRYFDAQPAWNEDTMTARGWSLLQHAVEIWPYPGSSWSLGDEIPAALRQVPSAVVGVDEQEAEPPGLDEETATELLDAFSAERPHDSGVFGELLDGAR